LYAYHQGTAARQTAGDSKRRRRADREGLLSRANARRPKARGARPRARGEPPRRARAAGGSVREAGAVEEASHRFGGAPAKRQTPTGVGIRCGGRQVVRTARGGETDAAINPSAHVRRHEDRNVLEPVKEGPQHQAGRP
jgi:hypothetical protein